MRKIPPRPILKLITGFHKFLYRATGGVVGGLVMGMPNLLLTHTGRKSGRVFTTPLFYLPDKDRFVVVASYGGNPKPPAWWLNLQAGSYGEAQVGNRVFRVRAEQADEELKAELWPVFARHYPDYDAYQANTDRVIPLVVLTPE